MSEIKAENIKQIELDFSLARITFLNTQEKQKIFNTVESALELSNFSVDDIVQRTGRPLSGKVIWNGKKNYEEAKKEIEVCMAMKIGFVKVTDSQYPVLLKTVSNPPYLLFYRGNLNAFNTKSVSVVGTRQITASGKKAAFDFAYEAVKNGVTVVSGLAKGVDSFAHKGACDAYFDALEKKQDVEAFGKTVAVLPGSIDEILPSSNKCLAQNIIKTGGCIISEYAPMIENANWHFVKRNRIIAALSPATVVIEAPDGSGALITADFALELGRDVMFHESCFCEAAKEINESVRKQLLAQYEENKITKAKLGTSSEKYVSDGAPVIKNFEDYCQALVEAPGIRQNQIKQLELDLD